MNTTTTTAKNQLHTLMVEMFSMIEDMGIQEGQYLQFAEMFKQMNININRLTEIKTAITNNAYYRRHIDNYTHIQRQRLTEEQKRTHPDYSLCNCGRYEKTKLLLKHYNTAVHYQGLRNRKYALNTESDDVINKLISREIALQSFIIKHLKKLETNNNNNNN